ncbi:hypothetical protein H206_05332 [Candidatus Electrothrix aarhusensis]|uniref:Uncharacterized protein n=1 Tax=Candidatus Electrothrix aarhusensis TaxID=1859131 RepID=A0A3S3QI81_9BACT|nr:hypothetical protein H206_05332 [Candidatus Electrothrix aarhusensis]
MVNQLAALLADILPIIFRVDVGKRQETVTACADLDKGGLQVGLNRDDTAL